MGPGGSGSKGEEQSGCGLARPPSESGRVRICGAEHACAGGLWSTCGAGQAGKRDRAGRAGRIGQKRKGSWAGLLAGFELLGLGWTGLRARPVWIRAGSG